VLAGCHRISRSRAPATSFYLVISTFRFFPGIPVFESADLVYWKQIGNVIERPSQLDFDGLSVSRGVFAPSIAFHDGTVLKAVRQALGRLPQWREMRPKRCARPAVDALSISVTT
jgi:hypothetical protein